MSHLGPLKDCRNYAAAAGCRSEVDCSRRLDKRLGIPCKRFL